MHVHKLGILTAASAGNALKTGDGDGKSPFTEGRTVTLVIAPSANSGFVAKPQASADSGTTWTDIALSADETAAIGARVTVFKQITLPNQIRANQTGATGSIGYFLLAAGA